METKLEEEVRFLKIYATVATLLCAVFLLSAFIIQSKKQKFDEIDVERINIVEKNGKLDIGDEKTRKAAIQALIDTNQLATNRLFLGKRRDNSLMLLMDDIKGRPRIRMQVAPDGTPRLEFLDEAGKVIYSLPNSSSTPRP